MADDETEAGHSGLVKKARYEATDQDPNLNISKDISNWMRAVESYVKHGGASCLEFTDVKIEFTVFLSVMEFLRGSQVTTLVIEEQNWNPSDEEMKRLCDLLLEARIKSLKVRECNLTYAHVSTIVDSLKNSNVVDFYFDDQKEKPNKKIRRKLVSDLGQSRLSSLHFDLSCFFDGVVEELFTKGSLNTTLTCLDLSNYRGDSSVFTSLFSKLPVSSIRDLDLTGNEIGLDLTKELSQTLADSKVEKLNLSSNEIDDDSLDILTQGLVHSSVTDLDLSMNNISGCNNFGRYLKHTKISVLRFRTNQIRYPQMFALPVFLKGSLVESFDINCTELSDELIAEIIQSFKHTKLCYLNIQANVNLGDQSIYALAAVLGDTNLEYVNFSYCSHSSNSLHSLNLCLNKSKLKYITASNLGEPGPFLNFWERTNNSSILSVGLRACCLSPNHAKLLAQTGIGSNIQHLSLGNCYLDVDFVAGFAPILKHTSITHLDFSWSGLGDRAVIILAEHLKKTKISKLSLHCNKLKKEGAIALSRYCPHTSVIHLDLSRNELQDSDLEFLAKYFGGSLVTTLNVKHNPGKKVLIEKTIMENRVVVHKLVTFFKEFAPENSNGNFHFQRCIHDGNVSGFLENSLQFYKRAIEQPAVISVLLLEESLSFSREDLVTILFENFPGRLVAFISEWIETDVFQLVEFLEQAEELGLSRIVELSLLNRPWFMIDEAQGILHPRVYPLLCKYNQPISSKAVEPEGIAKIIKYFERNAEIEGSAEVINFLSTTKAV